MINDDNMWEFIGRWCSYLKNDKYLNYRIKWRQQQIKMYRRIPKNIQFSDKDE